MDTPERIWLIDMGAGEIAWANEPNPDGWNDDDGDDPKREAVEYVRVVDLKHEKDALRRESVVAALKHLAMQWPDYTQVHRICILRSSEIKRGEVTPWKEEGLT